MMTNMLLQSIYDTCAIQLKKCVYFREFGESSLFNWIVISILLE